MKEDKFERSEIPGMFNGALTPVIMKLSMPILAGMVFQLLYNIVDTAFINFIDPSNPAILGGTGYVFPIIFVAIALGNGLSVGMSALVAKGIGEKDDNIIYKTAESGLFIALIISIIMYIFGYGFSKQIIISLGATGDYFTYGHDYFVYILPIAGFMFFGNVLAGILQGEGLMNKFMKFMIIGTVINIILDPIFIFNEIDLKFISIPTLGLGVKGAAIATVIGQAVSFLYLVSIFLRKQTLVTIEWKFSHVTPSIMSRIIKIGFPQSFGQLIMSAAFLVMNRIATHIDPMIVTSSSLVGRMEQLVYMPIFAIAAATITIVGQNLGRNNLDRVEKTWKTSMLISSLIVFVIAALYFIFAQYIYGAFKQSDIVTNYAIAQTRVIMPFTMLSVIVIITRSVYQAIGYPIAGLIITSLRFFVVVIPAMILYVYVFDLGFYGMLYGHITSILTTALVAWIWMKSSMKKLKNGTLKTLK
ncbi:MAG: MATE family efflux transporter [Spirochaetales bacterium]|nr:MATE family efflux transporter [Spirochaetales bacterium]